MLEFINYICEDCKKRFCIKTDQQTVCPFCGSEKITKIRILDFFRLLCSGGG